MNTSSRKLSTHTYKKSKKNKNKNKIKNRAYASNKNVIKINIHHPRNRRRARTVEPIKLRSINETPRASMFTNVHLPTPIAHREVVSSLQAMQHQQQIVNMLRQNDLNQKMLKQQE